MITVKTDGIYAAVKKVTGSTEKGDWTLLSVSDENGKSSLSVFVRNLPCEINEGEYFKIDKIYSVTQKNKQDKNGVWRTNVSIDADVSTAESAEKKYKNTSFEKAFSQLRKTISE